jgi:hypothetical protein
MKVKFFYLAVRHVDTKELLEAIPITEDGAYDEIGINYYKEHVTEQDIIDWAKRIYGDNVYANIGSKLDSFHNHGYIYLQDEARHLPSMGKMKLGFEEIEIDVK